ncbi:replication initiator protein RepSA [Actinacidiphila bryophytorum]|uniref:Replication initiator protein n=1 Tax=Actinacidiphila bryophytorum TaxID=1436133 RepID=A0A9W4GYY1_9ACTN|nr:replication initiator protein RepSA [Actinacidiphila bryophytorum]MBM9434445.1 replication initiation protein [Actinacidiphila bryophytorum]MBN6541919.1 replication initiation protein [Actinacidiphila bryophytorum]CAG7626185.1 Replication initiator protein [Actinacidiphila bryophytorum]
MELTAELPAGLDPTTWQDFLRVAGTDGFDRWNDQVRRTGGCSDPIHLIGSTTTLDPATGQVLYSYDTSAEPGGRLRVACGNRRASRCPACAWTYAGDTYQLILSGLTGGKGVPETVTDHPRVFATLTAPSFGAVHNRPARGHCRCRTAHPDGAPELGTPLDPETYDYAGAVLWNNHASDLWRYITIYLPREIAARVGITQRELRERLRVSYGKVAEYQKRGAIHFHAVIRFDGPDGPDTPPPAWATAGLLADALRAAAARATVTVPAAGDEPVRVLHWGTQLDVQPIGAFGHGEELTEQAVASYVAKYATKAAETTGTVDRRIGELAELDKLPDLPAHTRRLIQACWDLDGIYPDRRLWAWAHMLGFRGHFSTKARRYSTTLGALRQARADYRANQERRERGLPDPDTDPEATTLVIAHWAYAGHGHTPGESWLAQQIHRDIAQTRDAARQARAEISEEEEW